MSTQEHIKDLRSRFLWAEMVEMGVDATTPGQRELSEWPLYTELIAEGRLPVVSSNLTLERDGREIALGQRSLVVERGGLRVGVFGLISGTNFAGSKLPVDAGVKFHDPQDVARELVPQLRAQADLVVLLSGMSSGETDRLLETIPGIDIALYGDRPLFLTESTRIADTIINQSSSRGQCLGSLTVIVDPQGRVLDSDNQNAQLDSQWPAAGEVATRVAVHEDRCETLVAEARARAAESVVDSGTSVERYLGAETCARCHAAEYAQWSGTGHARAFATLQTDHGMELTDECVSCHVTGYDQPNGYQAGVVSPDLRGVQCEACHGAGTRHARSGGRRGMDPATCTGCHTGEFGKNFDLSRDYPLAKHTP